MRSCALTWRTRSATDKGTAILINTHTIRLDYGTAHETQFVIFLLCLVKLGLVPKDQTRGLVRQRLDP